MQKEITLNVNGQSHQVMIDPVTPLLYVLRNDLGLKGPKYGCGLEQCSTCKVLIDGADVPSCQLPVGRVEGAAIITVEGLGTADNLHPLQEAFLEEQAAQCGYCTAGMVMAAHDLVETDSDLSRDEIKEGMNGNLCRCTGYRNIVDAIQDVDRRRSEAADELPGDD
jgi:nicotinate dehydrogenase subunit A